MTSRAERSSSPSVEGSPPSRSPSSGFPGRDDYRGIVLYAPNRAPCAVDLSDNTNLWGVPPAAAAAVRDAAAATVTRYPSLYAGELKAALASYTGVEASNIVTGCGSDDVLDSAFRALAEPGDRVVSPDPSFQMIPLFARMNALQSITVPLTPAHDINADAMIAARGRITYLCSPNNPTGTCASRGAIDLVLAEAEGLVIMDEAYAEFAGESFVRQARERENLLVVRTMSKAFGLAGLRVGYAVGNPRLVAEVEKSRGPYKVNALAERAALAALTDDLPWVRARIAEVQENRERLSRALTACGVFEVIPSAANFVLAIVRPGRGAGAAAIAQRLRDREIAVRPFADLAGMGEGIRITIGPWDMMQRFLETLNDVLGETSSR